jgi:Protein of unknown function (DUF1304)
MTLTKGVVLGAAALHAVFALGEWYPWSSPMLLRKASANLRRGLGTELPAGKAWTADQQRLVATIVHNAGIYNAILAGGLLWAGSSAPIKRDVARVLLTSAGVAGVFGTATMKSPLTAVQAVVGLAGAAVI